MKEIMIEKPNDSWINDAELFDALAQSIADRKDSLRKVLLIPPDITRSNSGAGVITAMYYKLLRDSCEIRILPALGTHMPMSSGEIREMFGEEIPLECFLEHRWRADIVKIGEVPGGYIREISEGLMNESVDVEVNSELLDTTYDLVISIGQVVPHEVVGMANYSKNIFVGCGGVNMINRTHMLGAVYGMERIMGRDHAPVRKVFDYAEKNFAGRIPLLYVLTVTTQKKGETRIHGLFAGRERQVFEAAVALSQKKNLTFLEKRVKKVVVYLDEKEFKSTWLGNKAIYRTRMAIADGGELVVLAPGVRKFGEDDANDRLIRKYGYAGRLAVLELCRLNKDLEANLSVAAHLIHGSSDGRFKVTYAVEKLTREEIEGVCFEYVDLKEAYRRYDPSRLKDGVNVLEDGEEIFFISNPALGLWAIRSEFGL
jgi:nickel-dependent lactate racemase